MSLVLVEFTGILKVTPETELFKSTLSVNPSTIEDLKVPQTWALAECLKAVHFIITSPRV